MDLGSLKQIPFDLLLHFGSWLQSILRLQDNFKVVGLCRLSINDLAVAELSETTELDNEDGVSGHTGVSKSPPSLSEYS